MFTNFINGEFPKLLKLAHSSNATKLKVYQPISKLIQSYCNTNNLCIGEYDDGHIFSIYGSYIFRHANNISNVLAEFTPFVKLSTNLKNKEFTIWVDGIRMIGLYNIDRSLYTILEKFKMIPPEINLVSIYRDIYNPGNWGSIKLLYESEKKEWVRIMQKKIITKKTNLSNGSSDKHKKIKPKNKYIDIILDWLKNIPIDYVIVGSVGAHMMLSGIKCNDTKSIQIIVSDVEWAVKLLKSHIRKHTNDKILLKSRNMNVVHDVRLANTTAFVELDGRRHYICNIYNSAEYEVIPFATIGGYRIGTIPVLLRYLFIEIYIMNMDIKNKKYNMGINDTLKTAMLIHAGLNIDSDNLQDNPLFIGKIILKKLYIKANKSSYPYTPFQYKKNNGAYRII